MNIKWNGVFEALSPNLLVVYQQHLLEFLKQANLICSGMTITGSIRDRIDVPIKYGVGLVYVHEPDPEKHVYSSFADFVMQRGDDIIAARVFWNCGSSFPAHMGVPTPRRIRRAMYEFHENGFVITKMDDLRRIPAEFAEGIIRMKLIVSAALNGTLPQPAPVAPRPIAARIARGESRYIRPSRR